MKSHHKGERERSITICWAVSKATANSTRSCSKHPGKVGKTRWEEKEIVAVKDDGPTEVDAKSNFSN
jgi:hypothetical protein